MSDSVIHELAVAYAQAYLNQILQENPDKVWDNDTIRSFLKCYDYAAYQMPIEYENSDEHF